nr:MAG TPA: hypothetical protein [Caudoviricetes sp.]
MQCTVIALTVRNIAIYALGSSPPLATIQRCGSPVIIWTSVFLKACFRLHFCSFEDASVTF